MPHYLLLSLGTRGDVEPFLAAGLLLRQRGQRVTCVFPEQFGELTQRAGLDFRPLDRRFLELLEGRSGRAITGGEGGTLRRLGHYYRLARQSMSLQKDLARQQTNYLNELRPDYVVYHPKILMGRVWDYQHPGRAWMLSPVPNVLHPSGTYPQIGFNLKLPAWLNRRTYAITNFATAHFTAKTYRDVQTSISGKVPSRAQLYRYALDRGRIVYPLSPTLVPTPEEWPERASVTGFLERPKANDYRPDQKLTGFLARQRTLHKPLIVVTFGSMVNARPTETTSYLLKAVAKLGCAALFVSSFGGLEPDGRDRPDVFWVKDIPYDFIFPYARAVVHHGGAGTTHTALRHGRASLILPHIIDQFYWNRRVAKLGAGPLGVPIAKLTVTDARELLTDLLQKDSYASRAEEIGLAMRAEAAEVNFLAQIGAGRS